MNYAQWERRLHWSYRRGLVMWHGEFGPGWVARPVVFTLTERGIRRRLARKMRRERLNIDTRRSSA